MHGTVIDANGKRFDASEQDGKLKTEDDILIVDTETIMPVLFSVTDGIAPVEAVLARIEVKTTLTSTELKQCLKAASQVKALGFHLKNKADLEGGAVLQLLFAFASDLAKDGKSEHARLSEATVEMGFNPKDPPIDGMCVVGRGCWLRGSRADTNQSGWMEMSADTEHSEVLAFLGVLVNTIPELRLKRRSAGLGAYVVDANRMVFMPGR
jgi:hypothetical protein